MFFLTGTPPKSTNKLILARLSVSRPIYVNVDSPSLGFTYFNFLGGYQLKNHPEYIYRFVYAPLNIVDLLAILPYFVSFLVIVTIVVINHHSLIVIHHHENGKKVLNNFHTSSSGYMPPI